MVQVIADIVEAAVLGECCFSAAVVLADQPIPFVRRRHGLDPGTKCAQGLYLGVETVHVGVEAVAIGVPLHGALVVGARVSVKNIGVLLPLLPLRLPDRQACVVGINL